MPAKTAANRFSSLYGSCPPDLLLSGVRKAINRLFPNVVQKDRARPADIAIQRGHQAAPRFSNRIRPCALQRADIRFVQNARSPNASEPVFLSLPPEGGRVYSEYLCGLLERRTHIENAAYVLLLQFAQRDQVPHVGTVIHAFLSQRKVLR